MMGGNNPEDDEGSLDSDSDLILDGENDSEDSDEDGMNKRVWFLLLEKDLLLEAWFIFILIFAI